MRGETKQSPAKEAGTFFYENTEFCHPTPRLKNKYPLLQKIIYFWPPPPPPNRWPTPKCTHPHLILNDSSLTCFPKNKSGQKQLPL